MGLDGGLIGLADGGVSEVGERVRGVGSGSEGRNKHEEGGFGEVEISEQVIDEAEFVRWIDKNVSTARLGLEERDGVGSRSGRGACEGGGVGVGGGVGGVGGRSGTALQNSIGGGPHGNNFFTS